MKKALLSLAALALAATPVTARADEIVRTPFLLQGSIAYDCYGCAGTATFTGIATFVRANGGVVSVPASGPVDVGESCTEQGSMAATLQAGADEYQLWIGRTGPAVTITGFGPGGFYDAYAGAGTLTIDAPAGTCGVPLTATLTAPLVPSVNCYCMLAGPED